jgi:hypothetical protein
MRGPTYSEADLLAQKESPLVKKPDGLPSISQWMDVPADQNTNNGHVNNGAMSDSVAQDFSNMKLEEKTDNDKMPTPRAELEVTIQGLVARGNLHRRSSREAKGWKSLQSSRVRSVIVLSKIAWMIPWYSLHQ